MGAVPHQRTTTLWAEKVASRAPQSRVCHADASTVTPQLASQAALERRPDFLRTHMPECGQVGCHRGGGIGGFGCGWLEQPRHSGGAPSGWSSRPGSVPRCARSRQARPGKAREPGWGTAWRLYTQRGTPSTPEAHGRSSAQGGATLAGAELAVSAHCLWWGEEGAA